MRQPSLRGAVVAEARSFGKGGAMKRVLKSLAYLISGLSLIPIGVWLVAAAVRLGYFLPLALGGALIAIGVKYAFRHGSAILKWYLHRRTFWQAFGMKPPRDQEDWKERKLLSFFVLFCLKRLIANFKASAEAENEIISFPPQFGVTAEEVEEKRRELRTTRVDVERQYSWIRKVQNAAQFFGFKVPNDLDQIAKLERLPE
ncbi:MAG: hypothetical protein ACM3KM_03265 [Acidobacteriaceae bacterium]